MRIALLAAIVIGAAVFVGPVGSESSVLPPIVTVVRSGGLCGARTECRSILRITDTTISGQGYASRRLPPTARIALLRAISSLSLSYLRAHPFKGMCPTAYDGRESTYRLRGFPVALPSCKYDLRGVAAVQQTERLLATLRPA